MCRHPVQRREEVSLGRAAGPRALRPMPGRDVSRGPLGRDGVRQRQHLLPQRLHHEAGRLLHGKTAGGQTLGIV